MDTNTLIAIVVGMALAAGVIIYIFRRFNTAEADVQLGPHVRAKIGASEPRQVGAHAAPKGTSEPALAIDVGEVDAGGGIKMLADGKIVAKTLTAERDVEVRAVRPKD